MLSERFSVTSRKFAFLIFDEISILNPKILNALIIFFCMRELLGPSLLGIYINPLSWYNPI